METLRKIHIAPPRTASEIRESAGITDEDMRIALEALDGRPTRKNVVPPATASEIRKAIGVTKKDLQAALKALDGI